MKDNFKTLADVQQGVNYWKEDTFVRFLELPDALHVSPVLFQMVSFLGAFPFLNDAPAVLGLEEMVIVVTLLTHRYRRVLAKGASNRKKLLFKSLAVYDRQVSEKVTENQEKDGAGNSNSSAEQPTDKAEEPSDSSRSHAPGFSVDEAGDEQPEDDLEDEDDDLVLSAFELFGSTDAFKAANKEPLHGAMIPADNFRRLITLLLMVAPLNAQERLSQYSLDTDELHAAADNILAAFLNVEKSPGVKFRAFSRVLDSLPFMFDGCNALFEHFLFSRNLDFAAKKESEPRVSAPPAPIIPVLQQSGTILTPAILSQLSFFIPGENLFRRMHPLYSGDKDGFSMGSFETGVFNWRAPSLLLVRGTRYAADATTASEERFAASLPPKRFPDGSSRGERVTFGVYIAQPWRHSHKECFGDSDTLLFQIEPVQDVFAASTLNRDYVSFHKPGSAGTAGIAIGCPPPRPTASYGRRQSLTHLGPVSLLLDAGFEFGVFTHDYDSRGGAFRNSEIRRYNFQDRFDIESLEVWGLGGSEEAKAQAERWAWEAKEAEARRRINLGTGDMEADRQLLEMAGLIGGGNRSGGSMA